MAGSALLSAYPNDREAAMYFDFGDCIHRYISRAGELCPKLCCEVARWFLSANLVRYIQLIKRVC